MRLIPLLLVPLAVLLAVFLLLPQAAPVVLAQPAGWVELVGERTRTGKVFFDPSRPGARLVEVSVAKIHYDGPDWKDIDNSLVPSLANVPTLGLVDMEMVTDDYEFYALQTLNTIPLWFYRNKSFLDTYVSFNPQALQWTNDLDDVDLISMPATGTPGTVSGNRLHWEDAYGPGISLTLAAQAGRLAKALSLEAVPRPPAQYILDGGNPALELQFIFGTPSGPNAPEIWVDGILWSQSAKTETVGVVEFRVGGETIFSFAEPTAFDSGFSIASPSFVLTKQGPNLRVAIRVPLDFLQTAIYPVFIDPTVSEQVGASADDGWSTDTGVYDDTAGGGGIGRDLTGTRIYDTWARFTTVAITQGAPITAANITITGFGSAFDGACVASNLYFEDSDDAVAPLNQAQHAADVRTANFTAWDGQDFTVDVEYVSPSIVSVIGEVINRSGWSSNSALMLLWDDDGSSASPTCFYQPYMYDGDTAKAIQLDIEFTAWVNTAPTITNGITAETVTVDVAYARSFSATDPDTNQTLAWELNTTDAPFTITVWNGGNRTTWVNATPNQVGSFYANVTVGDDALGPSGNETAYVNFTLTVTTRVGAGTLFDSLLPVSLGIAGFFIVVGLYAMGRPGGRTLGQLLVFIGGLALLFAGFDYQLSIGDGQVALMMAVAGLGVVVLSSIEMTRGIGR